MRSKKDLNVCSDECAVTRNARSGSADPKVPPPEITQEQARARRELRAMPDPVPLTPKEDAPVATAAGAIRIYIGGRCYEIQARVEAREVTKGPAKVVEISSRQAAPE